MKDKSCPYCGSYDVEVNFPFIREMDHSVIDYECIRCECEWTESSSMTLEVTKKGILGE